MDREADSGPPADRCVPEALERMFHQHDEEKVTSALPLQQFISRKLTTRVLFCLLILYALIVGAISVRNAIQWVGKPFMGFFLNQRMVVGYIGQPHWSGTKAGLNYPDKILEANDKVITSMKDMEGIVAGSKIGEEINYLIDRSGTRLEVVVPTMRFTGFDLLMTFGIFFSLGIVYLIIGSVVYFLKPDSLRSWIFLLVCFIQSISSIVSFELESKDSPFLWIYIFNETIIPSVILHLSLLFPEERDLAKRYPYAIAIPYIFSIALLIPFESLYPKPISLLIYKIVLVYKILSVAVFIASILQTFFKKASVLARQRAKVVLFGAILALPIPALAPFMASLGSTVAGRKIITNFSSIPLILFPVSIAYAIAKHNLFDVDVFIKRTVGYAIMTAIVGIGYLAIQVGLESLVLAPVFGEAARRMTPVLFAFLVVFLFNPMNRRVQDAVDRMFYRKKFDYKATVTAVSEALSSVLNLDEIVRKIVHTIHAEMVIDRSGLVLAGGQGSGYPAYFLGDEPEKVGEAILRSTLPANDPLVDMVRKKKRLVTKYDVAEDPRFAEVKESCGKRFEELGASIAVPLLYQDEVKAVLAVGNKKSGHFFTREDIELLQTLASNGAVAIENAYLAEQMKKEETVRTNLSRYLSPQIVDRIVQNDVQVNLGGDRKVVTVLFSDIRNFTTITENRPPDQLVHILNEYFTEMAQIIFANQGSLDKYIGDAIVAVFGSLIPLENPAKNAVAAAVAMMKRLPELNRRWEARYDFYMNIGIGVNTGEVFLGNIGSPERMEFTVIGDAVNVASRFSGIAKAGQVLVTKETLAKLGTDFRFREHPPVEVKGKTGKLKVFEILYT